MIDAPPVDRRDGRRTRRYAHDVSLNPIDDAQRRNVAFLERFMNVVEPVVQVLARAQAALYEDRQLTIATAGPG